MSFSFTYYKNIASITLFVAQMALKEIVGDLRSLLLSRKDNE